jgi:ADP-heptose:LPS heptosyltransferase
MDASSLRALCAGLAPQQVIVVGVHRDPVMLSGEHVCDMTNATTLSQLLWLMRRAQYIISVDSGPMHIAAAVNDHTLGLHTWSDPRKVGPYNPLAWVWKAGRIAHRSEFSAAECAQNQAITENAAEQLAIFVKAAISQP